MTHTPRGAATVSAPAPLTALPTDWRTMPAGNPLDWLIVRLSEYKLEPGNQSPQWSTDLNNAIGLFPDTTDYRLQLSWGFYAYEEKEGFEFIVSPMFFTGKHKQLKTAVGRADTPALAMCRAWLALYEASL